MKSKTLIDIGKLKIDEYKNKLGSKVMAETKKFKITQIQALDKAIWFLSTDGADLADIECNAIVEVLKQIKKEIIKNKIV